MKMKDDERRLLGAAQHAGEFVPLDDISKDRCNVVFKQWASIGLVDPESGRLTAKGKAASGAIVPQAEPVAIEPEPMFEIPQDTYIGSPLIDDNELECDSDE